jgi:hypothetical protein
VKGAVPDGVTPDWVVTEHSFTLNRLKHPSDLEKTVLSAIIRAAEGVMPQPGDKTRAVGLGADAVEPGQLSLYPGYLPPEAPVTDQCPP